MQSSPVTPQPAPASDLVASTVGVEAGTVLLIAVLLAFAGWAAWTMRAMRRVVRRAATDHERLCDALERLEGGDFSDPALHLESEQMRELETAYSRMVPTLRTTIERLEWSAQHDTLTDLLNPASFKRACQETLSDEDQAIGDGVLLFFDVNDFKKINDSLGHDAGDRFLIACADRVRMAASTFKGPKLAALAAGKATHGYDPAIGRLGGDEFGIFLPGALEREEVERFIHRLKRLIAEPCQIGAHALRAKISVGVAFAADHHRAYEKLLAAADTAMYEAKSRRDGGHCFYHPNMRKQADRILERELELRNAIQSGQFRLYFQPQLDLRSNGIECAEALIRWQHPTRGIVMPSEFIPFAETYDLIDDIGDWVIHEAIRIAAKWWKAGNPMKVAINVSPKQLNRVELIPMIRACLKRYELPPQALVVEFTEAALMTNDDIPLERIEGLRRDGVSIALDDFGTGYSNLAQLLSLPLDRLKLDRSLLETSVAGPRRRAVLRALVSLAQRLDFTVVAEGVETAQQLRFLRGTGCHSVQGYLISVPLSEDEFTAFVANHSTLTSDPATHAA